MSEVLRYLLLANFFLLVMALFNHLVLSKETRFKTNRFIYISGVLLCLVLPLFNFNWFPGGTYTFLSIPEIIISAKSRMAHYDLEEIQIFGTAPYVFPWIKIVAAFYFTGLLLSASLLVWRIKRIQFWTRTYPMKWFKNLYITIIPGEWNPFSFMGVVYYPQPFDKADQKSRLILEHENIHIKQKHSWDVIFIEIIKIVFFYNPAIYTIKKQIQINHEYLADSSAVGDNRKIYSQELIRSQLQVPQFQFIQQFNHSSFLKRRLLMLMKNHKQRSSIFKYMLLLPLVAAIFWVTACTEEATPEFMIEQNISVTEKYAESLLSADYSLMNENEKKTKAIAIEMGKSGASDKEVLDYVKGNITKWAIKDKSMIESSNIFISRGLNIKDLKIDPDAAKTIVSIKNNKEDSELFYIVEEMPKFDDGGLEEFRKWVQENIKYPNIAIQNGIKGTVFVNFVIDVSGEVTSINIIRSVDPCLDDEVKRVLESAPKWEPGLQRGKEVKVQMAIPVKFALD